MMQSFEATREQVDASLPSFVASLMESLQSGFIVMPRGNGFVDYPDFEAGYQALRRATNGFVNMTADAAMQAVSERPMSLIVLRTILGFTPPEWAYVASEESGVQVSEGYARSIDKRIRENPDRPFSVQQSSLPRIRALLSTACGLIIEGAPDVHAANIHRLDKADTKQGQDSLRQAASLNVPYPMVLYERLLGRPFATHRDAVSEHVADVMEVPVEEMLVNARISYRKTKRAERLAGFDQAPDFCIPDEFNPQIVIEAKITEDAGTARDKITRVQRLCLMNLERAEPFQVIACIDGRGFVRASDVEKLIDATDGKVFTLRTLARLVDCTRLREFAIDKEP